MNLEDLLAGTGINLAEVTEPVKVSAPKSAPPRVNPPEGETKDLQATVEEVEANKPKRGRKAKPATTKEDAAPQTQRTPESVGEVSTGHTSLEGTIAEGFVGANDFHNAKIIFPKGTIIPVGARVEVRVIK